jgi:hypothetical protein
MGWVPDEAWLTKVRINSAAPDVTFDLAIDAGGGLPSLVDAGLKPFGPTEVLWAASRAWGPLVLVIAMPLLAAWFAATIVTRRAAPPPAGA